MATVTESPLTSDTTSYASEQTSQATASISPTANRLVLIGVVTNKSDVAGEVTAVSGAGLTFTQVLNLYFGGDSCMSVWRALSASPSSGVLTITADSYFYGWSVMEFASVDTGGTNGSAAIVQSVSNTAAANNALTVTLAAFGNAENATFGAFSTKVASEPARTMTPGSGFAEIHDVGLQDPSYGYSNSMATEWRNDNDTTVDATFSDQLDFIGGIAIEIKAAAAGTTIPIFMNQYRLRRS